MDDSALIKDFFHSLSVHDLETMATHITEAAELYFPKTRPLLGKDRILKFFGVLFRQFPELRFDIKLTITRGNNAAVHWTNRGTNRRGLDYENEGVTLLRFKEGRIDFISDFFKDTEKF